MATNLVALQNAIKLLADAAVDTMKAGGDSTPEGKAMEYTNLLPDLLQLLPSIGDIPAEVSDLHPDNYATLLQNLATDVSGLPAGKAENIAEAALKVLNDMVTALVPDIESLVAAIKA